MNIKKIFRFLRIEAEKLQPSPRAAMISIAHPGQKVNLKEGWEYLLSIRFYESECGSLGYRIFTKEDAEKILQFLKDIPDSVQVLAIHCEAGIRRSGTIASVLSEFYDIPLKEKPTDWEDPVIREILTAVLKDGDAK